MLCGRCLLVRRSYRFIANSFDGADQVIPGCGELSCMLGALLGAIVDSWTRPYFIAFAVITLFAAMFLTRWRSAALLGLVLAVVPLVILFIVLSPGEAASIQLAGRVVPTVLGGAFIASLGWMLGRLFVRLFRSIRRRH